MVLAALRALASDRCLELHARVLLGGDHPGWPRWGVCNVAEVLVQVLVPRISFRDEVGAGLIAEDGSDRVASFPLAFANFQHAVGNAKGRMLSYVSAFPTATVLVPAFAASAVLIITSIVFTSMAFSAFSTFVVFALIAISALISALVALALFVQEPLPFFA